MDTVSRTRPPPIGRGGNGVANKPRLSAKDRQQILEECIASEARWKEKPGRNLVLLFDGTGNILGNHQDTNVVRLLHLLQKEQVDSADARRQVVYYDPGVGSNNEFPVDGTGAWIASKLRLLGGLAMGRGVFENIADAYLFLVRNYRIGDRIFLFGFSRGAFTARALGGLLNMYGLVAEAGVPLIPKIVTNYFASDDQVNRAGKSRNDFVEEIRANFSSGRAPLVHFTGVWDSVETIGSGFFGGIRITNHSDLEGKGFVHVRQALSIHETRVKYAPRMYTPPRFTEQESACRSFDQAWFRGVHSDIGGSYQRAGLSLISLNWIVDPAIEHGLLVVAPLPDEGDPGTAVHDQTYESPFWAWTGIDARERGEEDRIHSSAIPVEAAAPAETYPPARKSREIGALLTVLVAACATGAWLAHAAAGSPVSSTLASVLLPQAQAGQSAPATLAQVRQGVLLEHALLLETLYLVMLTLWLAYPMAFALRRMARLAIIEGRRLGFLARHCKVVMALLVITGAYKVVVAPHFATAPTQLAFAASMNLACYMLLLLIFLQGVFTLQARRKRA